MIPAPFQHEVEKLEQKGYRVVSHGWTTHLRRHYGMTLEGRGRLHFAKMAEVGRVDLDDFDLVEGLKRTIWFSELIHRVRSNHPDFAVTTPAIVESNVYDLGDSSVAWIVMEYSGGQICSELPECVTPEFMRLCDVMAACHIALSKIELGHAIVSAAPMPPYLPHECLGKKGKALLECYRRLPPRKLWKLLMDRHEARVGSRMLSRPSAYVLDMGAFERKNFLCPPEGSNAVAEIIDTEFAGWTRWPGPLAKAFIRLWANDQRPDLARVLLFRYLENTNKSEEFFPILAHELLGKIRSGSFHDTWRRGKFSRKHPEHQLRRQLRDIIRRKDWVNLYSE